MMKRIKVLFLITLFCLVLSFNTYAAEYKDEIPDYVNFSGGAYIEVFDENLGTVTCVFPIEFKNGYIGFNGNSFSSSDNFLNVSNTTINGYVITEGGTIYTARINRLSEIEYRYGSSYDYITLKPSLASITATNVQFVTDDLTLSNESQLDYDKYTITILTLILLCEFLNVVTSIVRKGRR